MTKVSVNDGEKSNSSDLILGVDPGLIATGWGLIQARGSDFQYVDHGSIRTRSSELLHKRLEKIYDGISKVLKKYEPKSVAIENFFVGINKNTSIKTGYVSGVLLLACVSVPSIGEYAPNSVKKCLTGEGHAAKEQVADAVRKSLKKNDKSFKLNSHESDALALAICYARGRESQGIF